MFQKFFVIIVLWVFHFHLYAAPVLKPVPLEIQIERIVSSTTLTKNDKKHLLSQAIRSPRIAFFTGVLNPIHLGHAGVVHSAINQMAVDAIHVFPTVHTTHNETPIAWEHRKAMVELALREIPEFVPIDPSYKEAFDQGTRVALEKLFSEYSGQDVQWIHCMGADSFERFVGQNYIEASSKAGRKVLCIGRSGYAMPEVPKQHAENVYTYTPPEEKDVPKDMRRSSTNVRKRVAEGLSLAGFVTPEVERYIRDHGLYKCSQELTPPEQSKHDERDITQ